MKYVQCLLQRGKWKQVAWIPAKFAVAGEVLNLRADGNGWVVMSCGAEREGVPDYRKGVRTHRRATGDALPKHEVVVETD